MRPSARPYLPAERVWVRRRTYEPSPSDELSFLFPELFPLRASRHRVRFTVQSIDSMEGVGFGFVGLIDMVGLILEGLSVLSRILIILAVLRESDE